jgi:hypothetical protein
MGRILSLGLEIRMPEQIALAREFAGNLWAA